MEKVHQIQNSEKEGSMTLDAFLPKSRDPIFDDSKYSSVPRNENETLINNFHSV